MYLKRGKLKKEPCHVCGSPDSQMHHTDYSLPLFIIWLCRPCHLHHHKSYLDPSPLHGRPKLGPAQDPDQDKEDQPSTEGPDIGPAHRPVAPQSEDQRHDVDDPKEKG